MHDFCPLQNLLDLVWDPPKLLLNEHPEGEVFGASIWPLTSTCYQGFKTSPVCLHGVQRSISTSYKHSLNTHWLHMHTHNDWPEEICTTTLYFSLSTYCSFKLCLNYKDWNRCWQLWSNSGVWHKNHSDIIEQTRKKFWFTASGWKRHEFYTMHNKTSQITS